MPILKSYSVNRDSVCAVIVHFKKKFDFAPIFAGSEFKEMYDKVISQINLEDIHQNLRPMLYVPTEEKRAFDLLYHSPEYPIANLSDQKDLIGKEIYIINVLNLSSLLQKEGYPQYLDIKAIREIKKRFFTGKYVFENLRDFVRTDTPIILKTEDGEQQITPGQLYNIIMHFNPAEEALEYTSNLPEAYLKKLDKMVPQNYPFDPFEPKRMIEGPIKKFRRFY